MDKIEIANLRNMLIKLKTETITPDKEMIESLKLEKSADDIDVAVADNSAALASKMLTRQNLYLRRIDTALQKMDSGTYGECISCGDEIAYKRLLVRPTALLCIGCKEEQEFKEQREKERMRGGFLTDWE